MKAVYSSEYGNSDVLSVRDVPKPETGDKDILVKVACTTVNRTDCAILKSNSMLMQLVYGWGKPRRSVPGTDIAGTIEKIGKRVQGFNVGDRVYGFNDNGQSTQAEYCLWSNSTTLAHIPHGVSFEQAVSVVEGGHYALNSINKVECQSGQRILVNGATGAIGSALTQLLSAEPVSITATCRQEHAELVMALGADQVIDYKNQNFTEQDVQYDFVFDAVGKSRFKYCKPIMKPKAVYMSSELGPYAENAFHSLAGFFRQGKRVKFPFPTNISASLMILNSQFENDKLQALIDRSYSIDEVQAAYSYVMSGEKVGSVILQLSD